MTDQCIRTIDNIDLEDAELFLSVENYNRSLPKGKHNLKVKSSNIKIRLDKNIKCPACFFQRTTIRKCQDLFSVQVTKKLNVFFFIFQLKNIQKSCELDFYCKSWRCRYRKTQNTVPISISVHGVYSSKKTKKTWNSNFSF